jgi:GNAT superfamily N-acetyltransferase
VEDGGLTVRPARPADFDTIIAVVDDWWGRAMSAGLPRLFLDHFFGTSLIAEHDGELAGFLIGFLSPSKPQDAYIHFARVAPAWRRTGLARRLYEQFFDRARHDGRTVVKAITFPAEPSVHRFPPGAGVYGLRSDRGLRRAPAGPDRLSPRDPRFVVLPG